MFNILPPPDSAAGATAQAARSPSDIPRLSQTSEISVTDAFAEERASLLRRIAQLEKVVQSLQAKKSEDRERPRASRPMSSSPSPMTFFFR